MSTNVINWSCDMRRSKDYLLVRWETHDNIVIGTLHTLYYFGLEYQVREIAVSDLRVVTEDFSHLEPMSLIARKDGKVFTGDMRTRGPGFFFGSLFNAQE